MIGSIVRRMMRCVVWRAVRPVMFPVIHRALCFGGRDESGQTRQHGTDDDERSHGNLPFHLQLVAAAVKDVSGTIPVQ